MTPAEPPKENLDFAVITTGRGKTTIRNSDLGGRAVYTGPDATTEIINEKQDDSSDR